MRSRLPSLVVTLVKLATVTCFKLEHGKVCSLLQILPSEKSSLAIWYKLQKHLDLPYRTKCAVGVIRFYIIFQILKTILNF